MFANRRDVLKGIGVAIVATVPTVGVAGAEEVDLAYQTVRHHLDVLEQNDVIVSTDEDYGTVYLPSDRTRQHWDTVEQIIEQVDVS